MRRDQAINKVRKCLRLAESSNAHEAAAARRQAAKLMQQHHITARDVLAHALAFDHARLVMSGLA
jgi:hypothetical protein